MASPLLTKYVEFKAKGLTELTKDTKQYAAVAKEAAKWTDVLKRSVGGLPGLMKGAAAIQAGRLAGGVGMSLGGLALAGARSGLSGTVEEARLNYQLGMLNRQLGHALVPALDGLTRAVKYMRERVDALSPLQQRALGWGMAGVAAAGAIGTGATLLKSAHNVWRGAAVDAGAAALGSAAGQRLAPVPRQTVHVPLGPLQQGESALARGAAAGGGGAAAGGSLLSRGGMWGAIALAAVNSFVGPQNRREMMEEVFGDRFGKYAEWALNKVSAAPGVDMLHGRMPWQFAPDPKLDAGKLKKTTSTLLGGGLESPGSGYERIAEAYQMTGGEPRAERMGKAPPFVPRPPEQRAEEASFAKRTNELLELILKYLGRPNTEVR